MLVLDGRSLVKANFLRAEVVGEKYKSALSNSIVPASIVVFKTPGFNFKWGIRSSPVNID